MKFFKEYAFPLATAFLLCMFLLFLPDLKRCRLRDNNAARKQLTKWDALIMAVITLVYGTVAFWNLGNRESPQTFVNMEGIGESFCLPDDREVKTILFFTGVGIGSYDVEYSFDGEEYFQLTNYEQSHGDDLKWKKIELSVYARGGYIRFTGHGNVYLGEVVFLDTEGEPIDVVPSRKSLYDETELFAPEETYMNSSYFDEIYHARTAWEHLHRIEPYEITHPPLGKIIIGMGIRLFGMTPFGWRFSGTLFGTLMLPIMYIFLKKLFGGMEIPAAGTIVFASDFMHFTQTRIATIDSYAVFFILLMYLFMYQFITEGKKRDLALSGLFFGFGAASKWTCLYAGAGLAVLWLIWVIRELRSGRLKLRGFLKNVGFCIVFFIIVPCVIYYLSYRPYALAKRGMPLLSGDYLNMVIDNQKYMFNYHSGVDAEHPYSSRWYQWILDVRPILYYLVYHDDGTRSAFGAFVNPALCWGGLMCLFVLIAPAVFRKDRRAQFILIGYLAQLVPWMFIDRVVFEYHYFPCTVFLVMAVSYVFELYRLNVRKWRIPIWGFVILSVTLFIMFYPAISGRAVRNEVADLVLGWFPTWPF